MDGAGGGTEGHSPIPALAPRGFPIFWRRVAACERGQLRANEHGPQGGEIDICKYSIISIKERICVLHISVLGCADFLGRGSRSSITAHRASISFHALAIQLPENLA